MEYDGNDKTREAFMCNFCDYECFYNSDYKRHIMTAKHKRLSIGNKNASKNEKGYHCNCGKIYATRSGLWKHDKTGCISQGITNEITPVEKSNGDDYKSMIMILINENKELRDAMIQQNKDNMDTMTQNNKDNLDTMTQNNKDNLDTLKSIIPKIGNTNITKIDANINQNLNINVFLNEQCKDALNFSEFIDKIKISIDELDNQIKLGYVNGVSKILIDNLNALAIYQRPIHCTDAKRNTLYIKENDTWDKEGSQDTLKKGINEIVRKSHRALINLKENNSIEYADLDSEFSMKCIEIQRHITPVAPREVSIGKVVSNVSKNTTLNKMIE
jgi:hypothetical protein